MGDFASGDPYSPAAVDPDDHRFGGMTSLLKAIAGGSLTRYSGSFNAVSVSAAQDLFEVTAPSTHRVCILKAVFGQYSDFGDSQAELISITVLRGYTVSGSGGSPVTLVKTKSWGVVANSAVEANNTTVANTGTPETLWADTFNVAAGWWLPYPIWLEASERVVFRITAPADALTMNGSLLLDEVKK